MRERESPVLTEAPEEVTEEVKITHPLDEEVLNLRDGYIPSWSKVVTKLELSDKSRGEKKLFRSFYRAQRFYALGKKTKGYNLIQSLEKRREFEELEKKYPNELSRLVTVVSKGARKRL